MLCESTSEDPCRISIHTKTTEKHGIKYNKSATRRAHKVQNTQDLFRLVYCPVVPALAMPLPTYLLFPPDATAVHSM